MKYLWDKFGDWFGSVARSYFVIILIGHLSLFVLLIGYSLRFLFLGELHQILGLLLVGLAFLIEIGLTGLLMFVFNLAWKWIDKKFGLPLGR